MSRLRHYDGHDYVHEERDPLQVFLHETRRGRQESPTIGHLPVPIGRHGYSSEGACRIEAAGDLKKTGLSLNLRPHVLSWSKSSVDVYPGLTPGMKQSSDASVR